MTLTGYGKSPCLIGKSSNNTGVESVANCWVIRWYDIHRIQWSLLICKRFTSYQYSHHIHTIFTSYSHHIHIIFTYIRTYSHHIHIIFTSYSHHIHIYSHIFTPYSHHIHIIFTSYSHHIQIYSHHIHIIFTSYSHHIHIIFTYIRTYSHHIQIYSHHILIIFTPYSHHIHIIFTSYSHHIHIYSHIFTPYSHHIHIIFTSYSHHIQIYSHHIHIIFTSYSHHIHIIFTYIRTYSHHIHIIFTSYLQFVNDLCSVCDTSAALSDRRHVRSKTQKVSRWSCVKKWLEYHWVHTGNQNLPYMGIYSGNIWKYAIPLCYYSMGSVELLSIMEITVGYSKYIGDIYLNWPLCQSWDANQNWDSARARIGISRTVRAQSQGKSRSQTPAKHPRIASKNQSIISGWWLGHPSEKYERQLGWWHSQYGKMPKMATKPPTSFYPQHVAKFFIGNLGLS